MDEEERFFHEVRLIQRRTKCSNHVCDQFVRVFKNFSKSEASRTITSFDKKAKRAAGTNYFVLHGCPKCNKYVYTPKDINLHCPFPNEAGAVCGHPRFNAQKKPWEVLFFLTVMCANQPFYLPFVFLICCAESFLLPTVPTVACFIASSRFSRTARA